MKSLKKYFYLILAIFVLNTIMSCTNKKNEINLPYKFEDFQKSINGKKTELYSIENSNGMLLVLSNYGARIISLYAPDKKGLMEDVVLGCPVLSEYINGNPGVGATVGPIANRISDAQFEIDGTIYKLPQNKGSVCQHSGPESFYRQVWDAEIIETDAGNVVEMSIHSFDGQWGFPGNKNVVVRFSLTDDNMLVIDYRAVTDKSCYFNLTNHSYFNLGGPDNENILNHYIEINADSITAFADSNFVPSGEIMNIRGTDLDFTRFQQIGERINSSNKQMQLVSGYDHNYILNKISANNDLSFCARVYDSKSGRLMDCYTTEPAVQFYTANFLDGTMKGNGRKTLGRRSGLCLETQHYPDSPHHSHFPNTLLEPGDTLKSQTVFKFSVSKTFPALHENKLKTNI